MHGGGKKRGPQTMVSDAEFGRVRRVPSSDFVSGHVIAKGFLLGVWN